MAARFFATVAPKKPIIPAYQKNFKKRFLTSQFEKVLDNKIVVVLQHNNLTASEWINARAALKTHGIAIVAVRNKVMKALIRGGRYESMSNLFLGPTAIAHTNDDPSKLKGLVDYLKKNPKFLLVGAKVEKTLLAHDQIADVLALPGIDQLRAQLVGTIQGPMVVLSGLLQSPSQLLAANLEQVASR